MAEYKVIKDFADNEDRGHIYRVGNVYPRSGKEVTEKRLEFLASSANLLKTPVIERIDKPVVAPVQDIPVPVAEPVISKEPVEKPKPRRGRKKAEQ